MMQTPCITLLVLLCICSASTQTTSPWASLGRGMDDRNLFISLSSSVPIHPIDAFERHVVCVDTFQPDCDNTNVLTFVGASTFTDPQPNEFVYHDSGSTPTMQGAFWFQNQSLGNSILASFAITRGVSQGEVGDGTPAYIVRPRGDHNWAFSGEENSTPPSSSWLNEQLDVLYKFNRLGGTQDSPTNYKIAPEGKLFLNCLRFSFADWLVYLFAHFTMDLNTDLSDPVVQRYTSSTIWNRRSTYLFGLIRPPGPTFTYNAIQIVDGAGTPLQPAYDDFIASVKNDYGNRLYYYGLKADRVGDYESCWQWPSWF